MGAFLVILLKYTMTVMDQNRTGSIKDFFFLSIYRGREFASHLPAFFYKSSYISLCSSEASQGLFLDVQQDIGKSLYKGR